jgi:hypothetical protein
MATTHILWGESIGRSSRPILYLNGFASSGLNPYG